MNIFKLIDKLSKAQKIFFIGLIASLFLGLWFSIVSSIETKINNTDDTNIKDISFNAALCLSQEPLSEICKLRLDALELIKKFKQVKEKAIATNIEIWAPDDFNSLESIEKDTNKYFNSALFSEAINLLNEGIEASNRILEKASTTLNQFIDSGFNYLILNSSVDAESSFRKALEIDPDNLTAVKGLNRALVLDKVLNFVKDAQLLISINSLDEAQSLIDAAILLDNEFYGINDLKLEINELIQARDLDTLISNGYKYLKLLRFTDAKSNFDKALLIKENSKIVLEGINLANEGIKKNIIKEQKVLAYKSLNLEDFSKSSLHFQNILDLDPNIQFAVIGLQQVKNLKGLEFHLDRYINSPERLSSLNVFNEASDILRSSNSLSLQKRLSSKKEQLEFLLTEYSQDITITLFSDNKTQVSILNFGAMGIFRKKEIKLTRGKYTFIGKRKGFVTIRRIINFSGPTSVKIECIEKL